MMTMQEMFDKVKKHLLTQNKKAEKKPGGMCQYRTPDGLSCAAGCLMPDDSYDPCIEGKGIHLATNGVQNNMIDEHKRLTMIKILTASGIDVGDKDIMQLLGDLQECHDRIKVKGWPEQLLGISQKWSLSYGA